MKLLFTEMMRHAGVVKTPSPKDLTVSRQRDRFRFAFPGKWMYVKKLLHIRKISYAFKPWLLKLPSAEIMHQAGQRDVHLQETNFKWKEEEEHRFFNYDFWVSVPCVCHLYRKVIISHQNVDVCRSSFGDNVIYM